MRIAFAIAGVVCLALGTLWLIQGLGLVTIPPILCFANCTPLVGPSAGWAIAGLVAVALGGFALRQGLVRS